MRLQLLIAAAGAALVTTACDGSSNSHLKVTTVSDKSRLQPVASLECDEREGELRLVSRDPAGRSCFYRSDDGATAELKLVSLDGRTAEAALDALQEQLAPLVPAAMAPPEVPRAPDAPEPPGIAEIGDEAHVRLPGILAIRSKGESATIRLPGVSIDASDGKAAIRVDDEDGEKVLIDAHDGGAVIHADSTKGGDVRSTYIVTSETPGRSGVRLAGYAARGPARGPLVVGVLQSRSKRDRNVFDDLEDLVERASGD